jgi:hypothetical protein
MVLLGLVPGPGVQAVISLARGIQIHKFTKDHCGTVPIGWCLLCICVFLVVLLATWATQIMCKCANAQIAVPASLICLKKINLE